jgi:monoamine oxidase
MARTPLLRALQRQFRRHQEPSTAALSASPADASRRQFIAQAGVLVAAAALPNMACAGPASSAKGGKGSKDPGRVAIVGAGMAGLVCALKLKDHGIKAKVYEGSPRIGGRVFSNTGAWQDGQVSEWCGELIDTGHKTMRQLARRFGLKLDALLEAQPKGSEDTFYFAGAYYPAEQFQSDIKPVIAAVEADLKAADYPTTQKQSTAAGRALDAMSVREWVNTRVPGGMQSKLGQLLDTAYAIEFGADTVDQSALNLVYMLGYQPGGAEATVFGESDEAYHIRGGNEQLPKAIAQKIGSENIVLGRKLIALKKLGAPEVGYRLTFALAAGTEESVEADTVVLALPFSVLREVDLTQAGFDELKLRSIRELGDGRNAKTQLQFNRRIWAGTGPWPGIGNGSSYSDTGYQSGWDVSRAQPGQSGIMNFYSGGSVTLAQQIVASGHAFTSTASELARQDAQKALAAAEPVFPGLTAEWNSRFTQSVPHLHPLMRASYAYYRVGQYTAFGGYEGVTQGQVFFCGDHTTQDFQGFMEGAASEGERAAKEILKV